MVSDSIVRARIDTATKERATEALAGMGLSVSDAIRLLLTRVAADQAFPFQIKTPNATTRKAIAELEAGKGQRFGSAEELLEDFLILDGKKPNESARSFAREREKDAPTITRRRSAAGHRAAARPPGSGG